MHRIIWTSSWRICTINMYYKYENNYIKYENYYIKNYVGSILEGPFLSHGLW